MPANLDFGVSIQATDNLLLSLELNWVMWGVYDTLTFTFKEKGELLNSKNPRLYSDSYIPRLGIEYTASEKLTLRAGAYYDKTPTNKDYFNPETVSLNTMAFTFGFTYKPTDNLKVDFSFAQLFGQEMERAYTPANFSGKYKSSASIPGLGITYSF
jgi:long-chain fatty acid transport protein